MLTPERLAELKALAESATPGPWRSDSYRTVSSEVHREIATTRRAILDADFIAAADPPTVLALIAAAERTAELEVALREIVTHGDNYTWHRQQFVDFARAALAKEPTPGREERDDVTDWRPIPQPKE